MTIDAHATLRTHRHFARLHRHPLALTISALLLGVSLSGVVDAQSFPATVGLGSLDGSNGFRLDGISAGDRAGFAVSAAGDINGDGFDDVVIGAYAVNLNGSYAGSSYVFFGRSDGYPSVIALSSLDGNDGFRIESESVNDRVGFSVAAAGDVNGDGVADLIVGAPRASDTGPSAGSSYVVFGHSNGFPAIVPLAELDGSNGFRIDGSSRDYSGTSVDGVGDINGDGIDDLIVGAPGFTFVSSYIVFGSRGGFPARIDGSSLNGIDGFRLEGSPSYAGAGNSVSAAGDVNGDGLADLIVGGPNIDLNGDQSGSSFVLFGRTSAFAATTLLTSLDGRNGFRLEGIASGNYAGHSVSAAGDVNGDGIDDLIVGAPNAWANGWAAAGHSYVVFGRRRGFPANFPLSSLDGRNGFRLEGLLFHDASGQSVSTAGDINGDGLGDIIIGADGAGTNGNRPGSSYVVFGRHSGPFFDSGFEELPAPL